MLPLVSRGAMEARIVRRRAMTTAPTARAIARLFLGARVSRRAAKGSLLVEDSALAAQGDLDLAASALWVPEDLAADFAPGVAPAVMAAAGDPGDSALVVKGDQASAREISFPKIPKWPR